MVTLARIPVSSWSRSILFTPALVLLLLAACRPAGTGKARGRRVVSRPPQRIRETRVRPPTPMAMAHYLLGVMREEGGDPGGAIEAFRMALVHAPGSPTCIEAVGRNLVALGKRDRARKLLAPLVSSPDAPASYMALLASMALDQGRLEEAEGLIRRMGEDGVQARRLKGELARLLLEQGEAGRAAGLLFPGGARQPRTGLAARLLMAQGRRAEAGRLLDGRPGTSPAERVDLARACLELGRRAQALGLLESLLDSPEHGEEAARLAAGALVGQGEPGKAEALLRRFLLLVPEEPGLYRRTAVAAGDLGLGRLAEELEAMDD